MKHELPDFQPYVAQVVCFGRRHKITKLPRECWQYYDEEEGIKVQVPIGIWHKALPALKANVSRSMCSVSIRTLINRENTCLGCPEDKAEKTIAKSLGLIRNRVQCAWMWR